MTVKREELIENIIRAVRVHFNLDVNFMNIKSKAKETQGRRWVYFFIYKLTGLSFSDIAARFNIERVIPHRAYYDVVHLMQTKHCALHDYRDILKSI